MLELMRTVGVDIDKQLWRMPLTLRFPDGQGVRLPDWPAPFNVLAGIFRARGWTWSDKWAFVRRAVTWQLQQFDCPEGMTVAQLCAGLPATVMSLVIEPLCVSALNLPACDASAKVFLRVLRDALLGGTGSSDMLIPRSDQSVLLPDAAEQWLRQHGAQVLTSQYVKDVNEHLSSPVILACPAWEAARLAQVINPAWAAQAAALKHTAIATVYVQANAKLDWPTPVMALPSHPDTPAQFAFDKGRLSGDTSLQGVIAAVVSASGNDRDQITQTVLKQLREQLGLPKAHNLLTVLEKRAAFACTPGLVRPAASVNANLLACGDYVQGPYPSTLEAAVRSGKHAVVLLEGLHMRENTA